MQREREREREEGGRKRCFVQPENQIISLEAAKRRFQRERKPLETTLVSQMPLTRIHGSSPLVYAFSFFIIIIFSFSFFRFLFPSFSLLWFPKRVIFQIVRTPKTVVVVVVAAR